MITNSSDMCFKIHSLAKLDCNPENLDDKLEFLMKKLKLKYLNVNLKESQEEDDFGQLANIEDNNENVNEFDFDDKSTLEQEFELDLVEEKEEKNDDFDLLDRVSNDNNFDDFDLIKKF